MNQAPPTKSKSRKWLYFVAVLVAILFLTCLSPVGFFFWGIQRDVKRSLIEADSGFRKATNTIDPESLRAWAFEEIAKYKPSTNDYFGKNIPSSEIPDYVKRLYSEPPEDATVQLDGSRSYVMIMWGGGFFHWGFYVGSTNETMPYISDNKECPYNFEWKPGIYYTREANWKLQ